MCMFDKRQLDYNQLLSDCPDRLATARKRTSSYLQFIMASNIFGYSLIFIAMEIYLVLHFCVSLGMPAVAVQSLFSFRFKNFRASFCSFRASFCRDDFTRVIEGAEFLELHLCVEIHILASAHHDIANLRAQFHAIRPCSVFET